MGYPARPFIGHGVGLRVPHYEHAIARKLDVDWVEVISENFFGGGGRPHAVLEAARAQVPVVLHGVSMAVGSADPPSPNYLRQLRTLCDAIEPAWVSDHLCWGRVGPHHAHDLLPIPYTSEALDIVCRHVQIAQNALARPLVLENVSSYVAFQSSEMTEWTFLCEVCKRTGARLLLDLNNVIVSAQNFDGVPTDALDEIPGDIVWQFHLANHTDRGHYKFDSHQGPVPAEVWNLYEEACRRYGAVSSLIEWDQDIPEWDELVGEAQIAKTRAHSILGDGP